MTDRDNIDKLREHVDKRFDSLENKLDGHLERLSKAETSIEWIRGHVRIVTTFAVAIGGAIVSYFLAILRS